MDSFVNIEVIEAQTVLIPRHLSFFDQSGKGGIFVLCGDRRTNSVVYEFLLRPLSQGRLIMVVDAGNVFDPYLITRMAQARNREPREFLSRIFISRAFTCHQAHALVRKVSTGLNGTEPDIVLVLGLLATFYDEAVPLRERMALFKKTLLLLRDISQRGAKILVTSTDPPVKVRGAFTDLLVESADAAARLDTGPDGSLSLSLIKEIKENDIVRR